MDILGNSDGISSQGIRPIFCKRHNDTLCYSNRAALSRTYLVKKTFYSLHQEDFLYHTVHASVVFRSKKERKKFVQNSRP